MRKKRRTKSNIVEKYQTSNGLPETLGGSFMVSIAGLLHGDGYDNPSTVRNLRDLLRMTKNHKERAIRHINGCFMTGRETDSNYPEENFDKAKKYLAEEIQKYWGIGVEPRHLEPKKLQNWDNLEDIKLNFDVDKIPKIRRKEKPVEEQSWEQRLNAGEFDFDLDEEEAEDTDGA